MIHDRVTDVGTGVDTAVRRISTVYSINGQVERLTSWDNAAVGNGSIVNEVRYEYNQYGLLGKEYSNPVGGAGMLKYTQYFYDASKSGEYFTNELRLIGIAYPSGNTVTYSYGQIGLADDLLNRPVSVLYNNVVQATYEYQGLQTPITTTYPVPNLSLDYSNALDLYNRIIKQNWKNSNGESVVDIQHGYDRSGNRLNRIDAVGGTAFNELYSYDGMNQLINKSMESSFERFHYDAAGNHVQTTTDSAVETQTFNKANEIIAINNNSNAVSNDRNGNMTRIPGKDLTFDAWNRLVCVTHNGLTVAQYQYNALNHRVIKTTPFETRYYYFNRNWQCLEEYADNSATPDITYVWGLRYIDDMICRICSSETLYPIADANWNTVALANSSGNIVERYSYDAFGTLHIYDASFNERVASNYFWTRAFTGQVLDLDTGLMLYRNRYYSPSLGRFITRDPIGYKGDIVNLYRYANNQVVYENDPLGLFLEKFIPNGFSLGISRTCYGCIPLHRVIHLLPGVGTITSIASYALKLLLCIELQIRVDGNYCCDKNEGFVWRSKVEMCLYLTIKSAYSQESMGKLIRCTPKLGNPPKIHGRPPVIVGGPTRGMCPPKGVSGKICFGASVGYSSGSWGFRACYSPSYLNGDSNWFFEFGRGIFAVGTSVGGGGCMVIR